MRLAITAVRAADGLCPVLVAVVDFFAFDIVEALAEPGCALCRVLADFEEREMATFAREGRRVPEARSRFTASGGFCRRHAWLFYRVAATAGSGMPIADIYGQLVERDLERLQRARKAGPESLERTAPCPACEAAKAALARKADFFVDALKEGAVRAAYTESGGFCEAHLAASLAVAGDREPGAARFLLSDRRRRLEQLAHDLAEYDRKRDHRYKDEPKGDEQRSVTEVVRLYAGESD
jgi:Family of unknown function (DUF6062)